ncbi:MAG: hypothetical protein WC545_00835 [Patescibacteria group bacterium]
MSNKKITKNEAAKLISSILQVEAYSDAKTVFDIFNGSSHPKTDEKSFGLIVIEMTHFYINIVDRLIFQQLKDECGREIFYEIVDLILKNHLETTYKSEKISIHPDVFCKMFSDIHEKRQIEYGSYDFLPQEEGLKNNLFWEFEKKLTEIVDVKENIQFIMMIHRMLAPAVEKISKVIKEILISVECK